MCGKEWFEKVTIKKSKPSIAQQILLYLFTHKSVDRPEDIPHEESRTTSAITENVGGSPAGAVKALNNLSNSKKAGEDTILPVIKIRPKHGKGRLPGSPPIYYSLTRYGESEALALIDDLEFDINMKVGEEISTQRGGYESLMTVLAQMETSGVKVNISDKKKVVSHLIEYGCFDIEAGAESQLIKVLAVNSKELPYPTEIVEKVAGDLGTLSKVIKGMVEEMVGMENLDLTKPIQYQ